ncbi:MAG: DUF6273 domain-containing protein [Clostridia bacterium]|nr:DUF6273 domain-containing protein [Clostridia bacterium]
MPKLTKITVHKDNKVYVVEDNVLYEKDGHKPVKILAKAIKAGMTVQFGRYEQDANEANGPEVIEWQVLEVKGGKALVISKYGLDAQPYNTSGTVVTWENCTLRTWLNNDFLNKAFTHAEQAAIELTNVDNSKKQGYDKWTTNGGNNTLDKVFLLSYAEANKYFGVTRENSNNTKSRVHPTDYAVKQGAYASSSETSEGAKAGWWWLRLPGSSQGYAAYVSADGSLRDSGVSRGSGCIRPAFWVNLESGIF